MLIYNLIPKGGDIRLPPLITPHVCKLLPQKRLSIMGVQGGNAPLKILLNLKNKIPLPRLQGNRYLSGMGAGGGRGWGADSSPPAWRQTRPGDGDTRLPLWGSFQRIALTEGAALLLP